ncbi:unnamed protein product [Polarella glacialis]|uniref:Uncharacterized protein n=1 Tax=Polarella glacialis TaxID=89957 RepID=A0A813EIT1_POLGL|nr:unnamed protein product [Polarella glacialis]
MASPPRHPFWRLAIESCFAASGRHRWDDDRGGTGPRMLSALLKSMGSNASMIHVLPCIDFQRGIQADSGSRNCGHIADADARRQRGIHWSTTSHTAFVGAALRAEAFFVLHPELRGRAFFREPAVHHVAARSLGPPPVPARSAAEAEPLLDACRQGAGLKSPSRSGTDPGLRRHRCPSGGVPPVPRAEALLRNALELRPSASDVRYLLGSALQAQGRASEALFEYCGAIVFDPEMSSVRQPGEFATLGRVAWEAQQQAHSGGMGVQVGEDQSSCGS